MHLQFQQIADASKNLFYISESDHPFETIQLKTKNIETELKQIAAKPNDATVEKLMIEHFFRNMVKVYPEYSEEEKATANRFVKLQQLLKQNLKDVQVYRIGNIQIDAFIIGQLEDGNFAGLKTKLIET